jgi:hypothetical protein
LAPCPFHSHVLVNRGSRDAESHACAIATNRLKRDDQMFLRDDVREAIKDALIQAADGECPECARLRDA